MGGSKWIEDEVVTSIKQILGNHLLLKHQNKIRQICIIADTYLGENNK